MVVKTGGAFVVEGELALCMQDFGLFDDAFTVDDKPLDNMVADHFGAVRLTEQDIPPDWWDVRNGPQSGDRPIGRVRITIERL